MFNLLLNVLIPFFLFAQDLPKDVQDFLNTAENSQIQIPDTPIFSHYSVVNKTASTAVVFLPGMGEPGIKYYDLYKDLHLNSNTAFYWWDHIGQGFSYHFIPEYTQKTHIDSFDTQIRALNIFFSQLKKRHKKIIIIAHSMGAHLALRLLSEDPRLSDLLLLSAPMIDINQKWVPLYLITWLFEAMPETFYPPFYFLFQRFSSDGSYVSNNKTRQDLYAKICQNYPQILRGGATIGWIKAAQKSIATLKEKSLTQIQTPIAIFQAEYDYLVDNLAQNEICSRLPNCELIKIENSKHEILFELDPARNKALNLIEEKIRQLE